MPFRALVWGPAFLLLLPIAALALFATRASGEIFDHLAETVLAPVLWNTLRLSVCVGLASGVLALPAAWLTSYADFPGRRFFSWALALPLAVPGYIVGFVWIGVFDYAGPVPTWLREHAPLVAEHFPRVRSFGSAVVALSLSLYPYVYILARNGFGSVGASAFEAARSLGYGRARSALAVVWPAARPWIASGLALVLFETLADFGTVAVFNVDTFTTAIYRTWYSLQSLEAASQLSLLHLAIVLLVASALNRHRGRSRHADRFAGRRTPARVRLGAKGSWLAFAFLATLFAFAFLLPVAQLFYWCRENEFRGFEFSLARHLGNSLALGAATGLVVIAGALALASARRFLGSSFPESAARFATLGYGMPGTVLGVGLMVALTWCFGSLYAWPGQAVGSLLLGLSLRFFAVGYKPVASGFARLSPSLAEAARSLGRGRFATFARVDAPLLRASTISAFVLVFIDVIKEMPLTVMLKPWGWETLAVRVHQFTSEGQWVEASAPALAVIALACVPTWWMGRKGEA